MYVALYGWLGMQSFSASTQRFVKQLGLTGIPGLQTAFARSLIGLLIPVLIIAVKRLSVRTLQMPLQLAQGTVGTLALMAHFYAWTKLSLAVVTSLIFTQALFTLLFAVLIIRTRVSWRRWTATALGFVGVLIMVRPGFSAFEAAALLSLLAGALIALQMVTISHLPRGERQLTMLFYLGLSGVLITAGPGLVVWHSPSLTQILLLICNGLLGVAAQACIFRAFRIGDAAYVAPFDYAKLLAASALGLLFFDEVPSVSTVVGAIFIVSSTLYISNRERDNFSVDVVRHQT